MKLNIYNLSLEKNLCEPQVICRAGPKEWESKMMHQSNALPGVLSKDFQFLHTEL